MNIENINTSEKTGLSDVQTELTKLNPQSIRFKAVSEHLLSDLNGEAVVLSLRNGKYYGLNPVGSRIWDLLQNPIDAEEIENAILREYAVEREIGTREISSFLNMMIAEELVEIVNEKVF